MRNLSARAVAFLAAAAILGLLAGCVRPCELSSSSSSSWFVATADTCPAGSRFLYTDRSYYRDQRHMIPRAVCAR